jgi:hypothetical protein
LIKAGPNPKKRMRGAFGVALAGWLRQLADAGCSFALFCHAVTAFLPCVSSAAFLPISATALFVKALAPPQGGLIQVNQASKAGPIFAGATARALRGGYPSESKSKNEV